MALRLLLSQLKILMSICQGELIQVHSLLYQLCYDKPVLLVLECNETVAAVLIPDRFEVDSISTPSLLVPAVQLPGSCSDTFAVRALETGSGSDTNARVGSGTFLVNTKVWPRFCNQFKSTLIKIIDNSTGSIVHWQVNRSSYKC